MNNNVTAVTLVDSSTNDDIAKGLIADGLLLVQHQRDRRLTKLASCISASFGNISLHAHNNCFILIRFRLKNTRRRKRMRSIIGVIFGDTATYALMMKKNLDCKNAQGMVEKK